MKERQRKRVDFDAALTRGPRSYEARVAEWWIRRSHDVAHRRAYQNIAAFMREIIRKKRRQGPQIITDYATGNGAFLPFLLREFPRARVIALDGSVKMLKAAKAELQSNGFVNSDVVKPSRAFSVPGPAVRLVRTPLPNFSLPKAKADVVVFLFPNLVPSWRDRLMISKQSVNHGVDGSVAKLLATLSEDGEKRPSRKKIQESSDDMLHCRMIAENTRQLLKEGGLWFKVDYSSIPRDQLSELSEWKTLFGECALDAVIAGHKFSEPFRFLESRYFRSAVIQDVYEQTKDPEDRVGGFFVSALQAR